MTFLQQLVQMQAEILDEVSCFKQKIEGVNQWFSLLGSTKLEIVSVLFGAVLTHLDLSSEVSVVRNFQEVFAIIKDRVTIKRDINRKKAVMLAYDIIEEIKKCRDGRSRNRLEDLPEMLRENIREICANSSFVEEKWRMQDTVASEEKREERMKAMEEKIRRDREMFEKEQALREERENLIAKEEQLRKVEQEKEKLRIAEEQKREKVRRQEEQRLDELLREEEQRRKQELQKIEQQRRQTQRREEQQRRERERREEQERHRLLMQQEQQRQRLRAEQQNEIQRMEQERKNRSRCQSCLNSYLGEELTVLGCSHGFHPRCLKGYIQEFVTSNRTAITCPKATCSELIPNDTVLTFLESDKKLKERYEQSLIFQMVANNPGTMAWCPGYACRSVFSYSQADTFYRCEGCNTSYCLRCGSKQHTDMTCAQFEERRPAGSKRLDFKEPKFKRCPICNDWVQRNGEGKIARCFCGCRFCFRCSDLRCSEQVCRREVEFRHQEQ